MSQIKLLLDIIADVRHLGDSLEAYAEALTASDKLDPDDFEQIYPPVEDQPDRVHDLCRCFYWCFILRYDQRRSDRYFAVICRGYHPDGKASQMLSGHSARAQAFPGFKRKQPDPCSVRRSDLPVQQQSVFCQYTGAQTGYRGSCYTGDKSSHSGCKRDRKH